MATFTFYDEFKRYVTEGTIVLTSGTHTFKVAFTNTAPVVATDTVLANITEIATGGGYTTGEGGGVTLDTQTWAETAGGSGIWQFTTADEVFTASGTVAQFRYVVLYDDTPTSPANPLIGYLDYGSAVDLTNGATFTIDVGANGWFQLDG